MINSNELRIGNWYSNGTGSYTLSTSDFMDFLNEAQVNNGEVINIFPISLTPEILIKAGFDEWAEGNYKIRPSLIRSGWAKQFNYYQPYNTLSTYTGNVILKSLHQLQNLYFALTGTELEITL